MPRYTYRRPRTAFPRFTPTDEHRTPRLAPPSARARAGPLRVLEEFQAAHACNFKGMDADKDGRLTMEEMQGFMQGSRRSVTMEEMQGFMQGSRRSVPRQ